MEEIKSVRVRSKDGVDIRVSLYRDDVTKRIIDGNSGGIKVWDSLVYSEPRYSIYSNDRIIEDFIDLNRKLSSISDTEYYSIIQDPWSDNPPLNRKFGYDPYYLNNGSKVFISWFENGLQIGGYEWSDESGNELEIKSGLTQSTKSSIIKKILIIPPSESGESDITISDSSLKSGYSDEFNGTTKDIDIIQQAISYWKIKVPDYNLSLCDPNNQFCNNLEYKSPTVENTVVAEEFPTSGTQSKINLSVVLPENLNVSVRTDVDVIKVFIGKPFDPFANAFIFSQDDIDDSFLLEGSLESAFAGAEEEAIALLNETTDNPVGPSSEDFVDTESSVPGPGPVRGSKLTNKSGTHMINLAGHRLKLVLNDLERYLNSNGFPGAKLGNNGIMRDLRSSAYPSSPARAAASLHGAGLAIDLTFNIPGIKWKGIGDNANLADNPQLTKSIMNWVKSQGDLTWGAQWGKGSNPSSGIVKDRGVVEYHHFEIKSNLIPEYWEPVRVELEKFGFKPSDLKSTGRGSNLHKLMLKLLGDSA